MRQAGGGEVAQADVGFVIDSFVRGVVEVVAGGDDVARGVNVLLVGVVAVDEVAVVDAVIVGGGIARHI